MAEFVAMDVGLILAADIMLYIEIVLGIWAMILFSRFMPGMSATLTLFFAKLWDGVYGTPVAEPENGDHLR